MEKTPAMPQSMPSLPFFVPAHSMSLSSWVRRIWQDLQPTPGRLSNTLRIVLSGVLTLLGLLILQAPFAGVAIYFVFFVGRESPAVSLRSLYILIAMVAAVATELGIVVLTDNNPMARVLGIAAVGFIAGIFSLATTLPLLGTVWGFITATLIGYWETQTSANALVSRSLWIVGAIAIPLLCSIAVEYSFGARNPVELLQEQRSSRWRALSSMFTLFAEKAPPEKRAEAATAVARLAILGQDGMQSLYDKIVERNFDAGSLHVGARVRITMLAQLMDLAAAAGAAPYSEDPIALKRYERIALQTRAFLEDSPQSMPPGGQRRADPNPAVLDRIEGLLLTMRSMQAASAAASEDRHLAALPAKSVPFFIPGMLTDPATVYFALKVSLCATICYVLSLALGYPGILTSVVTVFITGLSTTGAIKQRFVLRIAGAIIGGLIFGMGSIAFLFPHMDSITSFLVLFAAISFISAWCTQGRQFAYLGLQIAFGFSLVTFEGFSAPTQLAPARDRLIGILLALVVMWLVFDHLWPVRTVSAMRRSLSLVLHSAASLFRFNEPRRDSQASQVNALRDKLGKTIVDIRTMNDTVEYEFGPDYLSQIRLSQSILRAALATAALFWNQLVLLHSKRDRDVLREPTLTEMRQKVAAYLDAMAESVQERKALPPIDFSQFVNLFLLATPRNKEFAENSLLHLRDLQGFVQEMGSEP